MTTAATTQREATPRTARGAEPDAPAPPTEGARTAWLTLGSVLAVAGLGWGTFHVVDLLAHEERTEVAVVDDPSVRVLEVDVDRGALRVVGADVTEITVTSRISEGLRETGNDVRVEGDRLVVESTCPDLGGTWCSVDHTIEVPSGLAVVVRAADGSITLQDLRGVVDVRGDNGSIRATDVSGPSLRLESDEGSIGGLRLDVAAASASSHNGSVRLEFDSAPTNVTATSDNGSVTVVVPRTGEAYRVEIDSDNGSVTNDVPNDPAAERTIVVDSVNGSVTARHPG